ncbi:MAG: hypothetical protein JW845_03265 [Dehalococcoidales bacterium]|nr:hypothetical protein [Dehalococcoidales bacterium]
MKKIIKKFWGVAFVIVLLSTLLVGAIPQAAAGNFFLGDSLNTPGNVVFATTVTAPAPGFGILDVAQSGATIYAVGDAAGVEYLYKSTDGGNTWVQIATPAAPLANTALLPSGAGITWGLVAVAPDDPNVVVVVNTEPSFADVVYLSMNGGITFNALPATGMDINAVDISMPLIFRYIAIGGNTVAPAVASGGGALLHWNIGAVAPAWAAVPNFANLGVDDVEDVEYSSQFMADQCLLAITETVGTSVGAAGVDGLVGLHVYRYDLLDWDQNVDTSFPRYITRLTNREMVCGHASMVLDGNFYVGDISSQIAFIAANITANTTAVGTQVGGIYRVYGSPAIVTGNATVAQIDTGGVPYNTVAWDGTNLMASQLGQMPTGLVVQRSSAPLAPFVTFLPNTAVKTPGTGNATIVLFNTSSGNGLAFSQGNGSAICRTPDYGKSWNGFALANTRLAQFFNLGTFTDMWSTADGSTKYFMVDDAVDIAVWKQSGFTWERVFIRAAATGENWTINADADNPDSVFIARVGATSMYKSTDGGNTDWNVRTSSFNISDIAVQDANTVYVAIQGQPWVLKGTGPFTIWTLMVVPFTAGGGNSYSLTLLADDQLIVGGTAGGVAYTTDGGTTWVSMLNLLVAGNVVTAATGLATGDSVYAVSNGGGTVSQWTFGTNLFMWTITGPAIWAGGPKGIALSNGVLWVMDNRSNRLHRMLRPAVDFTITTGNQTLQVTGNYTHGINTLHAQEVGTTSTVWAIDNAGLDPVDSIIDYIPVPSTVPTLVYPLDGTMIPVNSLNGAVSTFIFKWTSPPVVVIPVQAYSYNIEIYLDSAGLIPVAGSAVNPIPAVASVLPDQSYDSATAGLTGAVGIAVPGETYYWRVRVEMGAPVESYWTEMQSFTIEQLVAIVPVIASPVNGGEVNTTTPGFSWSPISGATSYRFELATDSDFTDIVYTVDPSTAGAQLPSTITLERGMQYFWRVKTLTPTEGEWSTVANFVVAELPPETTPVTITTAPQPTITNIIEQPAATTTVITVPPVEEKVVNPSYIWAIIVVGAVLVIAVIILIVRTRRTV